MSAEAGPRAVAVAVVIGREDGRTLLVRRAPGRTAAGFYTPVTGRLEPRESLAQAAAREALEEVGLTVAVGDEIFACDAVGAPFHLRWLEATVLGDPDALRLSHEVDEARWATPAEAAMLEPMFDVTRRFYAGRSAHPGAKKDDAR